MAHGCGEPPLVRGPHAPHINVMIKFTPILLALAYGYVMYRFSAWRTARELDEKSTELADASLRQLCDRMAASLDLTKIKVHIYEIEPVNGLAAPDGRIFITRGFYNRYRAGDVTAEEMASVIAHELGHVALGHSRRRMIDFSGQNALRTALAMILSRFLPGIGVWVAGALTSLLAAKLSRKDEYEADAYALAVDGSAPALELAVEGAQSSGLSGGFSTRRGDAFDIMAELATEGAQFEVVICDPPAFAPNKQSMEAGLRAYERVARLATALVAPGGYLGLCSCSHSADLGRFRGSCNSGIGRAGRSAQLIHTGFAGADHPQLPQLAESGYLKALFYRLNG